MNVKDFAGRTPLHWLATVKVLLSHPDTDLSKVVTMDRDNIGFHFPRLACFEGRWAKDVTTFHLAAFQNHFEVVDAILKKAPDPKEGNLLWEAFHKVVDILLKKASAPQGR